VTESAAQGSDALSLLQRADALHAQRRLEAAVVEYRRALALDATLFEAWYGLGASLLSAGSHGAAAEALGRAVALRADADGARCNLAEALFQLGCVDEAVRHYEMAAASHDAEVAQVSLDALVCIVPGAMSVDNAGVLALRQQWAATQHVRVLTPAARRAGRKLRVGYVSAFFGDRNWMKPVFGVINRHDRSRFEIHLLSDGGDPSEHSGYVDHDEDRIWQINSLRNEELAGYIAAEGIDVLVDLNGYSAQRRLPLFMQRPARCQIGWFNMFATTGIAAFDWLVGDDAVLPPGEEAFYCERIHRVPGSYLAFDVRYPVPEVAVPPCLRNGFVTFGCLASNYKLTDATIEAWAEILRAAPSTRMVLKNARLGDGSNRDDMLGRFARLGVEAGRFVLEGPEEHFDFLRAYGRIDVALDPFPYNGGTTTTEALWQGVSVLCCNGDRWAGRTSRSLLLAAGLGEWVADDAAGYVAKAIELAGAPDAATRLGELRASMRERLRASAVCDCALLCCELETLYLRGAG
jgi:predicted O-linked N-acetylglucosamine transferase (SPINDLY family)